MTKQRDERPTVLMFHARYRTPGGEEGSFNEEAALFESMGYSVVRHERSNEEMGSHLRAALSAIFNPAVFFRSLKAIQEHSPTLIYVNNLWPALSPAVLWAARLKGIPTLQALRNYRLICPSAKVNNEGACLGCGAKVFPFKCIARGCYNNSRLQSLIVALFSFSTRLANSGRRDHKYLTTSGITKNLLIKGGLSPINVRVRPNFLTPTATPSFDPGRGVVYVGRLSEEKGVSELISHWSQIPDAPVLTLIGDGPLAGVVRKVSSEESTNIKWIGSRSKPEVLDILRRSSLSIVPSLWAEPFGRVAIESMSVGTPVIHTNGGALTEIVGDTGIFISALSSTKLSAALQILDDPVKLSTLRHQSFARYRDVYSNAAAATDMNSHVESVNRN